MTLDRRLNAYRDDLADARLRETIAAPRYAEGRPARVVVGEAALRRAPGPCADLDTFCHYGEPLLVFDVSGDYAWCQSLGDGYVGYVELRQIALGAQASGHFIATLGSYTYRAPDLRSTVIDFLPRHSAVAVVEAGLVTRGTEYARLDTGGCLPMACLSPKPPRSPDIVAAAELYLGCPYRWGGRSARGIDCSGLVQSAFRDIGANVPRDTDMQRDGIGAAVTARETAELRRGDLVYLPGHVLIYAGDGAVIHADGGTMMVRRDNIAEWLGAHRLVLGELTVRRPPVAAGQTPRAIRRAPES